jgi:hypothetical protein
VRREEQALVAAIRWAFGNGVFDTSLVIAKAMEDPELIKAIKAAIPHALYRSGFRRGEIRDRPLRQILTKLAKDHFYVETETGRRLVEAQ